MRWPWNKKNQPKIDPYEGLEIKSYTGGDGFTTTGGLNTSNGWTTYSNQSASKTYRESDIVFGCVNRVNKAVNSVHWLVQSKDPETGSWVNDPSSPLQALVDKPNPQYSWSYLLSLFTSHYYLTGNSIFYKVLVNNGKVCTELWPIQPSNVKPIVDKRSGLLTGYKYTRNGMVAETWEPSEVIHMMFPNPDKLTWGMAPLQAAMRAVSTANAADEWNLATFDNRGVPSGYVELKNAPADATTLAKVSAGIQRDLAGATNARGIAVLPFDAKFTPLGSNAVELDYLNGLRMSTEKICRVFGIPPVMVGDLSRSTYSNYQTAERDFWFSTAIPFCELLADELNTSLQAQYGTNTRIWFSYEHLPFFASVLNEKTNVAKGLFSMGVPFNEINQRLDLGMPTIVGGDTGYLPTSIVVTQDTPTPVTESNPNPNEDVE